MTNVKFLFGIDWDFDLYQIDNKKIITINYTTQMTDYFRSFYLTDEEQKIPYEQLSQLAKKIRSNYEQYKDNEIIPPISLTKAEIEKQLIS